MSLIEKAMEFLRGRRMAYLDTFDPEKKSSRVVLEDLAKFCRANETTFHPDPHVQAQLEGRREVWLRLQHHLQLSDAQLWELYGRK